MKCVNGMCKRENRIFQLYLENAIVPIECDAGHLRALFAYFQYRAPNIDSFHSPLLDVSIHEDILNKMLCKKFEYHFCAQNIDINDELRLYSLSGDELCSKCKRFVCKRMNNKSKRDSTRRESDLECLLRHIRNALAHGHVFVVHGGNYIAMCFEDISNDKNVTARIICGQADLRKWRSILETAMDEQKEREQTCPA